MNIDPDDAVVILDAQADEMEGQCNGPDPSGACPRVPAGAVVPCAGRRVVPAPGSALPHFRLHVPCDSTRCPLAWIFEADR
jgi:hypothetical protein